MAADRPVSASTTNCPRVVREGSANTAEIESSRGGALPPLRAADRVSAPRFRHSHIARSGGDTKIRRMARLSAGGVGSNPLERLVRQGSTWNPAGLETVTFNRWSWIWAIPAIQRMRKTRRETGALIHRSTKIRETKESV